MMRLDIATGHLQQVNAGHPAPLLIRAGPAASAWQNALVEQLRELDYGQAALAWGVCTACRPSQTSTSIFLGELSRSDFAK
ncbi:hypothetical protein P3T39_005665 [Kitasatospora sp. GP82]|nr:hypothetical protein [Kitasatospora sp. GP82]